MTRISGLSANAAAAVEAHAGMSAGIAGRRVNGLANDMLAVTVEISWWN
jgi:hypothetical protein